MTPLTPAGQALLVSFETLGGRHRWTPEYTSYRDAIAAIEHQAADRALAGLGTERLMVVLRPWLGIQDDVELERACRRIGAALIDKASKPEEGA